MSSKEFDSIGLIKKNISPNEPLKDAKHLKDRILIGGNLFIRRFAQIERGDNSDAPRIVAEV